MQVAMIFLCLIRLNGLPGANNYIRYLPNAMHYFGGNLISSSTGSLQAVNAGLNSYFYFKRHCFA